MVRIQYTSAASALKAFESRRRAVPDRKYNTASSASNGGAGNFRSRNDSTWTAVVTSTTARARIPESLAIDFVMNLLEACPSSLAYLKSRREKTNADITSSAPTYNAVYDTTSATYDSGTTRPWT